MTGKSSLKKYKIVIFFLVAALFLISIVNYLGWPPNLLLGSADSYSEVLRSSHIQQGNYSQAIDRPFLIPIMSLPLLNVTGLNLITTFKIIYLLILIFTSIILFKILPKNTFSIMAIIAFIITPYVVFMSFEVERAPVIIFYFLITLLLYNKYREKQKNQDLIASAFFLGILPIVHVTSYFFILIFMLFLILFGKNKLKEISIFLIAIIFSLILISLTKTFGANLISEPSSVAYKGFLINLATGFTKVGANRFFNSLIDFLSPFIFFSGLLGAIFVLLKERNKIPLMFVFWMGFISFLFAIQFESFSHSSRYPFYVIIPFIVLSINLYRIISKRLSKKIVIFLIFIYLVMVIIVAFPQDLNLYKARWNPHLEVCSYLLENSKIDDQNQLLYLGWPSITFNCEQGGMDPKFMHFFGWNRVDLDSINDKFIKSNNIIYYIYDHTGSDYYNSSEIVFHKLEEKYDLKKIKEFSNAVRPSVKVELYEIGELK